MTIFRKILFWSHLAAGIVAGLFIGVMSFTGAALAFQDEIVAWSERDARQVSVPTDVSARLPLTELQRRMREAQPDLRGAAITLRSEPAAAVNFSAGRDSGFYVNPYTGEIRQPASSKVRDFMETMLQWHRFLAREGDQRAAGKAINGACNIAFCVLAITGLYLWMPRTWSWRGVKAVATFNFKLAGKARDFNWHNVIGLWSAPVLIVLTLTAVPISYRWGSNLIYRLVGEEPPAQQGPGSAPAAPPAFEIKRPSPDAHPLGYDVVIAQVQKDFPAWTTITLRSGGTGPLGQNNNSPSANPGGGNAAMANAITPTANAHPRDDTNGHTLRPETRRSENGGARGPQALTVTIREPGAWPRTATTTLTVNPFTGEILKREGFADLTAGRRLRTWTRFLHTGQALGWPGQLVAGLACLGSCFLIYTGFALSWRRFLGPKINPSVNATAAV